MQCFIKLLNFIAQEQPEMDEKQALLDFLTEQCTFIINGKFKWNNQFKILQQVANELVGRPGSKNNRRPSLRGKISNRQIIEELYTQY